MYVPFYQHPIRTICENWRLWRTKSWRSRFLPATCTLRCQQIQHQLPLLASCHRNHIPYYAACHHRHVIALPQLMHSRNNLRHSSEVNHMNANRKIVASVQNCGAEIARQQIMTEPQQMQIQTCAGTIKYMATKPRIVELDANSSQKTNRPVAHRE